MPRPNPPRKLFAEPHLAQRVAIERESRGWSYEGLAKRMTDLGCPIQSSAIYKIEKGKPRRRITVDELVAFSRAFDLKVAEMLVSPELKASAEAVELLEEFERAHQRYGEQQSELLRLQRDMDQIMERLHDLVGEYSKAERTLRAHLPRIYPELPASFHDTFMAEVTREAEQQ